MPRQVVHLSFILSILFCTSSCRDTPESLAEDMIKQWDEGTELLNQIADGNNVEQNLARLEKWVDEMNELMKKFSVMIEDLDQNDQERLEKLQKNFSKDYEITASKFSLAASRVEKTKHSPQVKAIFSKFKERFF